MHLLSVLKSTQRRKPPSFFGTHTIGWTKAVGAMTFWMVPCCSRESSSIFRRGLRGSAPDQSPETSSSIVFLPDSGAEIDAIPSPTFKKFFDGTRLQRASSPETATGTKIRSDGTFQAKLTWNANAADLQSTIHTTIHVLQDLQQPVLSTRSMKALGMLVTNSSLDTNAIWGGLVLLI